MSDDIDTALLVEGFRRQLAALVTPAAIRDIEDGASPASMWASIDETGFVDARPHARRGCPVLDIADGSGGDQRGELAAEAFDQQGGVDVVAHRSPSPLAIMPLRISRVPPRSENTWLSCIR